MKQAARIKDARRGDGETRFWIDSCPPFGGGPDELNRPEQSFSSSRTLLPDEIGLLMILFCFFYLLVILVWKTD